MSCRDYNYKFCMICLIISVCFHNATAQNDTALKTSSAKQKDIFSVGLGIQRGFIFAHSEAVQNTKGSHPTGGEVILSWQRNNAAVWNLCNCFPRKGLLLNYYDYDNAILGKSMTAAYFLEPTYKLAKNTFFSFKGAAGVSYLTNPFDSLKNPSNQSYSTDLSVYLLVGLGVWFKINDHLQLNASVNYQHESNGGVKEPNKGINWPTAGLALSYQKTSPAFYTGTRLNEKFWRNQSPRIDIGLFGLPKRAVDERGISRRMPLIGFSAQVSKQVGRINAITLGTEIYRDEELRIRLKKDTIKASAVKAGILFGHEFLLGKFLFSQRLGLYVFDQTPYYDQLYHRWGVQYQINRHFSAGFNLQAHRQIADFIDLRILYTFQK